MQCDTSLLDEVFCGREGLRETTYLDRIELTDVRDQTGLVYETDLMAKVDAVIIFCNDEHIATYYSASSSDAAIIAEIGCPHTCSAKTVQVSRLDD